MIATEHDVWNLYTVIVKDYESYPVHTRHRLSFGNGIGWMHVKRC